MKVCFDDCVGELVRTSAAAESVKKWENRSYFYDKEGFPGLARQQEMFRDRVKAFVHERMYTVIYKEISEALSETDHALKDLEKAVDQKRLTEYGQWPFSFSFFFHSLLEESGKIPLWKDLWESVWHGQFRPYYRDIMPQVLEFGARRMETPPPPMPPQEMENSAWWRLGKYYYSALREMQLHAGLREGHGIRLKYHIFADFRMFVDGWTDGGVILCLLLRNDFTAEKGIPEEWVPEGFRVERVYVDRGRRGEGWRFSEEQIAGIARRLEQGLGSASV